MRASTHPRHRKEVKSVVWAIRKKYDVNGRERMTNDVSQMSKVKSQIEPVARSPRRRDLTSSPLET